MAEAGGGAGANDDCAPPPSDSACLRHCKTYLRRRLAYAPPLPTQGDKKRAASAGAASGDVQGEGGEGGSPWSHLWPIGRHTQCEELRKVLHRTVFDGESQSALLLGYTASGKSLVLDRVLRSLAEEAEEAHRRKKRKRQKEAEEGLGGSASTSGGSGAGQEPGPPFRAVYLNGMAQTDDGIAMREIAEQLGVSAARGGAYSSDLEMAVESMKTGAANGIPVVFVLDEFESFAYRKPQTLLYALLDLCQDKSICAAVVGLSANLNVLEEAEKRIKSRFSFRQVQFPQQDFDTIASILIDALTVPEGGEQNDGSSDAPPLPAGVTAAFARDFNSITRKTILGSGGGGGGGSAQASVRSANVELKALAGSGRSVGWFLRLASTALGLLGAYTAMLGSASGHVAVDRGLTREVLLRAAEMLAPDPHEQALRSLTVTQALVLVTIARLERRGRKRDGCAFQTVFREYESYLRKFPVCPLRYSRDVIFKSYRQLAEQGLVRAAESGTGGGRDAHPVLHARFRSRFDIDEIYQAMQNKVVNAPTNVVQWCKNWQKES